MIYEMERFDGKVKSKIELLQLNGASQQKFNQGLLLANKLLDRTSNLFKTSTNDLNYNPRNPFKIHQSGIKKRSRHKWQDLKVF
jgi:hypothetical protein